MSKTHRPSTSLFNNASFRIATPKGQRPLPLIPVPVLTAQTAPLRVDGVPLPAGVPGTLGLTLAPGKTDSKGYSAHWKRDLATDLNTLVARNTTVLVCLLEEFELKLLRIPTLLRDAARAGLRVIRHATPDGGVTRAPREFNHDVETVANLLRAGANVVVHCRGGLGRAGTFAACVLVALGMERSRVIEHVRAYRKGAVETMTQERFVLGFRRAPSEGPLPAFVGPLPERFAPETVTPPKPVKLTKNQKAVYEALLHGGAMTRNELNHALDSAGVVQYDKRLAEMLRMGIVRKGPARECNRTGRVCTTWEATLDAPRRDVRPVSKKLPLNPTERAALVTELKNIRADQASLGSIPSAHFDTLVAWLQSL